jgi:signal transduction histidine kinase
MSIRTLKWFTICLPPFLIGAFEYARHDVLSHALPMETGNLYITLLSFILSFIVSTRLFKRMDSINSRLADEQAKRAVFEERERLARDLHDNIAQTLFFLNVQLMKGELEQAKSAASEIDNDLRQAIFNLRRPAEDGTVFADRLHEWIADWALVTGTRVIEEIEIREGTFDREEEVLVFGFVQEAFTNIRKHADAETAVLLIRTEQGGWRIIIKDNGAGIGTIEEDATKQGISMLRSRAEKLGAQFRISEVPGGGTELSLAAKRGGART